MARRADVRLDSAGVRELLNDPGVRRILHEHADRVAQVARSTAPVETGRYRDSITVQDATTDRAVVRVRATAPHAHLVEARTGHLARALGSSGL